MQFLARMMKFQNSTERKTKKVHVLVQFFTKTSNFCYRKFLGDQKVKTNPIQADTNVLRGLADWNCVYNSSYRLASILGITEGLDPERYKGGRIGPFGTNKRTKTVKGQKWAKE